MKILQVNNFYNYGSTGKITFDIHKGLLEHDHQSLVCYGRGKKVNEEHVTKICSELYSKINNVRSRITGIMYGGFWFSTNKLIKIIKTEKPDVVHLQCINCYFVNVYRLVEWLKKNKIKTVLTLHAEFMYTANCGHALNCKKWQMGCGNCPRLKKETRSLFFDGTHRSFEKMRKAFCGFQEDLVVISVSPWLRDRASQSPILRNMRHAVIYNGVDTRIFHHKNTDAVRLKHQIEGKKVIFHATASFCDDPNHLKGGWYVLELAKRMKDIPVVFLVAGKYQVAGSLPGNVILLDRITEQELLAEYYSLADATILTSKKETFSMICAESLCCGTPVFGFKAGAPELISLPEYSCFVDNGDLDCLEKKLVSYLSGTPFCKQQIERMASQEYSKEKMLVKYLEEYRNLCQREKYQGS